MPPLLPTQVLGNSDFLWLSLIAFLVMVWAAMLDPLLSRRMRPLVTRCDRFAAASAATLLRLGMAAFFGIALWYFDGHAVYLTPELHASAAWVAPLQAVTALALLWRRTAWLGALAIGVLYGAAGVSYGWFHMLDYPVFLGVAACIALDARGHPPALGLALLRASAGVTLMWAAGEKWLYPWWSNGVLDHELQAVRGVMSSSAFMAAAGWIEFCAAFALVFGRVGVLIAAWVLMVPFIAAIPVFGVLDAIGHAPILLVLVVLGLTRSRLPRWARRQTPFEAAVRCTLTALATVGGYWLLQALAYGRSTPTEAIAVAVLTVLPIVVWWRGGASHHPVATRPWFPSPWPASQPRPARP